MTSSVFFKFKSQREPTRVAFDGTGISVFELKRSIIELNRLGDGTDFDLAIYNEDNNEEYDDDAAVIPRSTSVVARRLPPVRPGKGSAARYVSGKMPTNNFNTSRVEKAVSKPAVQKKAAETMNGASEMAKAQSEEERIEAMFKAGAEQWNQQQQEMANATPVYRNPAAKGKPNTAHVPNHPPPSGYICYRCGEKGHWIQECPTNNDPNFDGRPRVKRTTGIPKSFLRTIEKPAMLTNDGLTDTSHQPSGVMVNADGDFVVAEPDKASWEQYQAKTKGGNAAADDAAPGSEELRKLGLECSLDHKLFIDPAKTPCCKRIYCNECITNSLIENDLKCPGCEKEGILIDDLVPDEEMAAKVKAYLAEKEGGKDKAKEKRVNGDEEKSVEKEKDKEDSKPKDGQPKSQAGVRPQRSSNSPAAQTKSPPPRQTSTTKPAPTSKPAPVESGGSKKRPAEDEAAGQRSSQAPKVQGGKPQAQSNPAGNNRPAQTNGPKQDLATSGPSASTYPATTQSFNPGMGQMGMPGMNAMGYMGTPMSMAPAVSMDPSMMNTFAQMNNFGGMMNGFPMQNGADYMMSSAGMYGNGFNGGMMGNNGYANYGSNLPMYMNNGGPAMGFGMNGAMGNSANGFPGFPNQQGPFYSGRPQYDDDSAYFRKPVNPHRQQPRQRRLRPSDYQELSESRFRH